MSTRTTLSTSKIFVVVLCTFLGGCADCSNSDKGSAPAASNRAALDPAVQAQKFPTEKHPLAPFIEAGTK